jgi:hypothetical protein
MRALQLLFPLLALTFVAQADMFSDDQAKEAAAKKTYDSPCEKIERACSNAGVTHQDPKLHDGNDQDDDCFAQVINGQSVTGVELSDSNWIQQCLGAMPRKGVRSVIPHH